MRPVKSAFSARMMPVRPSLPGGAWRTRRVVESTEGCNTGAVMIRARSRRHSWRRRAGPMHGLGDFREGELRGGVVGEPRSSPGAARCAATRDQYSTELLRTSSRSRTCAASLGRPVARRHATRRQRADQRLQQLLAAISWTSAAGVSLTRNGETVLAHARGCSRSMIRSSISPARPRAHAFRLGLPGDFVGAGLWRTLPRSATAGRMPFT